MALGGLHGKDGAKDSKVSQALGITKECLEGILRGGLGHVMKLRVIYGLGVGMGAKVCLGWCDTKGYHMVGVGGQAAVAVRLGVHFFAGRSRDGGSFKIILGIGNFAFEYVVTLPTA